MQIDTQLWPEFIKAVRKEVVPALGCTEPISLALAAAIAREHLGAPPQRIDAAVSPNLMKNGMGVTVPGTGMVGMPIAAAVGALAGDPHAGLEVLKNLQPQDVAQARAMLDQGLVRISVAPVDNVLYSEARLQADDHWVRVAIADAHTRVVLIEKDGQTLFTLPPTPANSKSDSYSLAGASARAVFEFATLAPLEDIRFIAQAGELNTALSDEGLKGEYGLAIGASLQRNIERGILADDLLTRVLKRTTAASDARMGGAMAPAMSNSGSGNQGIAASMPVVVVADHLEVSEEQRIRALMLSNLMAIYIKSYQHKLSALCAVTTAAMGSAAGMAWLLGGDVETVGRAICNMIGDVAGMICDGANNGCAMKVSSSVGAAVKAVLLALDGIRVGGSDGIVSEDVDQTIRNLASLVNQGMVETDQQILRIMLSKD
ncbi:serine dehydratase subunit alpha family protein [Paludibacterium sp. B53371]|uniref:L-cysteine desulfidase family protein n=1 Tax=Paludibacterium sp. B53371 TaxID=2806263 RepID=UPI001C0452B8|nr:L-serine ammonia-lyase, iron-sulfur-dependent, subunit alpha [Paludibacterium sp. B53371]